MLKITVNGKTRTYTGWRESALVLLFGLAIWASLTMVAVGLAGAMVSAAAIFILAAPAFLIAAVITSFRRRT